MNEILITVVFKTTWSHRRNAELNADSKLEVNMNLIYYYGVNSKHRV